MADSILEVVNLALTRIGQPDITDITGDDPTSKTMNALYNSTRIETLSVFPWNCAIKRAQLPATAETNLTNYENGYDLPADLVRVLDIPAENPPTYRIEGAVLWTDGGDGTNVIIRYIHDLEDTTKWDEIYLEAVVVRLAEKACMKITQNLNFTAYLQQQFVTVLTIAQQNSAEEDQKDVSNMIAQLNNSKLANLILAGNNYATG